MNFYRIREEDRQFLYSLLYATGIVLFWRGIWEVSYEIPLLKNVYFCLFVGLAILTLTGYMYREFDLFHTKKHKIAQMLHEVQHLTRRGEQHEIFYYDDIKGDEHKIMPDKIKKIEADFLVYEEKGHEFFLPLYRITRVHKGKQLVWKR